ncbi:transglutaminaseTgpA domain-containing protein [Curtobacterium caseinilyticum]|uniref:TransglutaminaseTgpA domain-containing protein n=1 Tax=Curtobacterium caseinilyticum TaxID=3055137 RepID=A0ABT7TM85_9MICO|nr:transglutaminaseTgpA domain-containing protein [Curtobacterium caseinilyticum]MDM7890697.1 transglutaminaseTgpA domain-containing protein [Curtobacterium caseinilyticum]
MTGTTTTDRPGTWQQLPGADRPAERPDTPSAWVVALAPLPVLIGALAMRPLVQGIAWWVSGVVFAAVLVCVVLAVRRRAPGVRFIALVTTLVIGSCVAAVANDVHPLGWLDREGALGEALAAIRLNPAPLPQTDAVRLVVTIAIGWVAGVSLFLAAIAPTVALAAVPALVVLIVPGVVTGEPASPVLVVLVGAAFLGLLWLSVRPVQRAFPAAVVGAIGLVVAVGLPALVPLNASWLSGVTGALQSPVQPGRPGTLLELGRDLRQPNELEVLRYRTADGQPEYLKLADLDEFGSGDWVPTVTDASTSDTADRPQWAVGVNPRLASRGDLTVRITGLSSNYLPVPAGAASLESQSTNLDLAQWRWMGNSSTVRSTGPTTQRGSTYEAFGASTSSGEYLDAIAASGLLGRGGGRGFQQPSAAQLRTDLSLPDDLPEDIAAAARRVAGSGSTDYEEARALEQWFRSDLFTYSETAPVEQGYDGDSMDVVDTFLRVRQGYCVHFASSMAVMARTLGIPSRIAVGYRASSEQTEDGEYTVSNRQLHSWPELYIRGAGWVSFEPTPSSDAAAQAADQSTATPAPAPTETPLPAPGETATDQASPTPTPSASAEPGASAPTNGSGTGPLGLVVGLVLLLAVLVAPGAVRALRRRQRLAAVRAGRSPAVHAWREVLDDVADHGYAPGLAPPGDPAAAARTARAVLGRLAGTVPSTVLPHLRAVVDAVDVERFAADGAARVDTAALDRAVREARIALDASVPRVRVLRSRLFPPSLLPSSAWSHEGRRRRTA